VTTTPNILLISGLDPSGGAGFLADARIVGEHGLRAVGVVTGLTEQNTAGVRNANVVSVEVIDAQLRALLADVEVAAVKIGMLGNDQIAEAVADALALTNAPVVWDPVLHPTRGRIPLYTGSASRAVQLLAPHVSVLTPNLAEAAALTGGAEIVDVAGMRRAGEALRTAGMEGVVVTGGHLSATATATATAADVLVTGQGVVELVGEWIDCGPVHGTGCALSTAIACRLARGDELEGAVRAAKDFVASKLRAVRRPGRGIPAVV
jgi:hydroxymethylpyrimidine/phosphomethylpyrimidine kinase